MSWLNKMTLLTHFFYWWKGYVFVVPKKKFWLYIQISCVSLRSSTTLWLPYCSIRSCCKITAIFDLFEQLLLRTAVYSLTITTIFFLLHQCYFWGILYSNHTLNEDQIFARSIIKTGISQRGELWFNSAVLMKTFIYFYIYNNIYLFFFYF